VARSVAVTLCVVGLLALFLAFVLGVQLPGLASASQEKTEPAPPPLGVELVKDPPDTLRVPEDVRVALGIRKGGKDQVAVAKVPTATRPLVLSGSTALDPTRLMRIRARFAPAEVVEIGQVADAPAGGRPGPTELRELRSGDFVKKGQLLGVFYSVDVGSKKNDLIDALVQLDLDQKILDGAEKSSAALPEVFLLTARKNVENDRNAIARALNTLKVWNISEEDIDAVYKEAAEISKRKGKRDRSKDDLWARVELKAPDDGTVVERNVAVHEIVVDPTVNLFQIARVDRMLVLANAPEDDLPALLKLPRDRQRWTVHTVGAAAGEGIPGRIDDIGYLIDVNQHSAVVRGYIDNPPDEAGRGRLRAGQFVSCTIDLPPPGDVVEVPVGALVDDGRECVVFVQDDPEIPQYTLRRVEVRHRFDKTVFVRSRLTEKEQEPEEGLRPRRPLRPGERILATGVLELKKELEDRQSKAEK
jgi:cobalt-zinc-cadmium efflux system membrane fusion protein